MRSRFREIIFLTAMFAMLGCTYALVRSSAVSRQAALNADTVAKRQAIAEFAQSAASVEAMQLQMADVSKSIDDFQRHLARPEQIGDIVSNLSRLAVANSLATQSIKMLPIGQQVGLGEQPVELSLTGDFNGVYALLLQIEKLPQLTRVTKLKINKTDEQDSAVRATITLNIYFEPNNNIIAMSDKELPR